jgi:hypothetical protein
MTTETIYLFAEQCNMRGSIYHGDNPELTDDAFLWGEGTREELIQQAIDALACPPGGAPHFDWDCARTVLAYLDGPKMHLDADRRAHYPIIGSIETDRHGRCKLILRDKQIVCLLPDSEEVVSTPEAECIDDAALMVSQLYNGAEWELELAT